MTSESEHEILFEKQGQIALVTFNRPKCYNAMTWSMYDRLIAVCDDVDQDDQVRVMILQGAGGKAFVSGTDIRQFTELTEPDQALAYERRIDRVMDRVEQVRAATIAVLRGACTGGGALLALSCDFRFSSPDLRFGVPIARTLGNCLSMRSIARLLEFVGPARVKEMIMLGRLVDADRAQRLGLVDEVVPPEQLDETVRAVAQTLCGHAPLTLKATKEAIRRLRTGQDDGDDLILSCYMSQDFQSAVRAFLEKRRHEWTGK